MRPVEHVWGRLAMRRWAVVSAVAFGALSALASCSTTSKESKGEHAPVEISSVEERFPYTTAEDARTFTDALVQVVAVDERIGEHDGEDPDEGYRARWVAFEVVEPLWYRQGVTRASKRFEAEVMGFAVRDGKSVPLTAEGAPVVAIGEQYLVGMLTYDGELTIASSVRSILPVVDGRIAVDIEPPVADPRNTGRRDFRLDVDGLSVEQAAALISNAKPIFEDEIRDAEDRLERWLALADSSS